MKIRSVFAFCAIACVTLAGCSGSGSTAAGVATVPGLTLRPPGTPASIGTLTLASTTFVSGTIMPANVAQLGCGTAGANMSPQLSWSGAPATTRSYVLTEFDQDAPTGVGFWHWTLFDIPAGVTSLAAGAGTNPPAGSISGLSDYGTPGYGGPCPPTGDGAHRYTFTVYALDEAIIPGVNAGATGAFITFNIRGHILAQGTYLGLFAL
jgi:Raf kinase inhibitor-like YbhB/YbcL family protein